MADRRKRINCPHCGEEIVDIYEICPKCKNKITREERKAAQEAWARGEAFDPMTKCPSCGEEVSKLADTCPKCGRVLRRAPVQNGSNGFALVIAIVIAIIIAFWLIPQIFTLKVTVTPIK